LVHRGPDDLLPRPLLHGHGLAGGHGFVHCALALDHDPIGGDLLPGADDDHVPDLDGFDRHLDLRSLAEDAGRVRPKLHQPPDRPGGAALGRLLHVTAGEVERHDHRRHAGVVGERGEERRRAGEERDGRAEGDEGVHVRGAVPHRGEGRAVGTVAHCQGGQREEDHPRVEGSRGGPHHAPEHVGDHPQDDGDGQGPREAHSEPAFSRPALRFIRWGHRIRWMGLVSRRGHGGDEVAWLGESREERHGGPPRGQVHGRRDDPRDPGQGRLHVGRARGTGHPADGEGERLHRHVVASVPDRPDEGGEGHVLPEVHRGPLCGQVHLGGGDAGDACEGPLHVGRARGAGHPPDGERKARVGHRGSPRVVLLPHHGLV